VVVQLTRRVRLFASCTEGGHPSSENDRPPLPPSSLVFAIRVCEYVRVYEHVSSLFLLAVATRERLISLLRVPHYHRGALERAPSPPVVRVPRLLFLPEFFLLSTVRSWLLPAPSTVFARRLGRRRIVSRSREWSSFVSRYLIL